MDLFFGACNEDSASFSQDILRCPFLRNIKEPTNFSFASSMSFPTHIRGGKGPIFEDGPNFDMAFRLFHGRDGVVPLSERSFIHRDKVEPEQVASQFNPLAARAATISLSSFGPGGPFSFDSFSEKFWKDQKKPKKDSSGQITTYGELHVSYFVKCLLCSDIASFPQGETLKHEAARNEWLQNGNCPIAKSYRAVSNVLPLVANVLKPPPGMKYKCPPAVVAARAALARTAFAKTLRPQPLPAKVLVIGLMGMAANVPLGIWREHTEKFSPSWFAAVHAAVPFIAILRKSVLMPKTAMAFTIAASILGQVIGSRAERHRLKTLASEKITLGDGGSQLPVAVSAPSRHCGDQLRWSSVSNLQVARGESSSSADMSCR